MAEGRSEWISELVAELIGLNADVLVAGTSVVALADKKATSTIPIVMVATDPVGLGLVASLPRARKAATKFELVVNRKTANGQENGVSSARTSRTDAAPNRPCGQNVAPAFTM